MSEHSQRLLRARGWRLRFYDTIRLATLRPRWAIKRWAWRASFWLTGKDRKLELLRKVAEAPEADGNEYMPAHLEADDMQVLEREGLVEEGTWLHPVWFGYRVTSKGRAELSARRR